MPHGIQGAPGVGYNLTADGNYDMVGRKLTNVGAATSNSDAATKKYVDENSGGGKTLLTVDSNTDMKDSYRILKLHLMQMNQPQNNMQIYVSFSEMEVIQ